MAVSARISTIFARASGRSIGDVLCAKISASNFEGGGALREYVPNTRLRLGGHITPRRIMPRSITAMVVSLGNDEEEAETSSFKPEAC